MQRSNSYGSQQFYKLNGGIAYIYVGVVN
jgi:hypothetical protein